MEQKMQEKLPKTNFIDLTPLEIVEFDIYKEEGSEYLAEQQINLRLFNNFLEYNIHYIVVKEFVYDPAEYSDEEINKALETEEKKTLKVEEQGLVQLKDLLITRRTENRLNKPGEGTTLEYIISIEQGDTSIVFKFTKRSKQIEVFNKLINWQIKQNGWK